MAGPINLPAASYGRTLKIADLMAMVAAYLELETTDLDQEDIKRWALDGLRWLLPLAPEMAVESVILTQAFTYSLGIELSAFSYKPLKVVRVLNATDGDQLLHVDAGTYAKATAQLESDDFYVDLETDISHGAYGAGSRVWTELAGNIYCYRVDSSDQIAVGYIGDPEWDADDHTKIPVGWEGWVALYCAVQFKHQDEELEQAAALYTQLAGQLQKMGGFEDVPSTIGG